MIRSVSRLLSAWLLALFVVPGALAQEALDGGTVISRSPQLSMDADAYRKHLAGQKGTELRSLAASKEALLDRVLDIHSNRVLELEAESLGLDADPRVAALIAEARQRILVAALVQRIREQTKMPETLDALARERYTLRKHEFVTPERRQVAHILLRDRKNCPCDKTPPAIERAAEMREELLAGTAEFADLARTQSKDNKTAAQGGVIPEWIVRNGETIPAFEDAVYELAKIGDISEPVKTNYGVHLVKLVAVEAPRQLSFDEVKPQLVRLLEGELLTSAVEKKRSAAYPDPKTVDLEALAALVRDMAASAE